MERPLAKLPERGKLHSVCLRRAPLDLPWRPNIAASLDTLAILLAMRCFCWQAGGPGGCLTDGWTPGLYEAHDCSAARFSRRGSTPYVMDSDAAAAAATPRRSAPPHDRSIDALRDLKRTIRRQRNLTTRPRYSKTNCRRSKIEVWPTARCVLANPNHWRRPVPWL